MSSKITKRPTHTEDFKRQLVALHAHGKRKIDLVREYGIRPAALDRWVKQAHQTGSFKTKYNMTPEQLEIRQLKEKKTSGNGERYLKAISAMQILNISRATYYQPKRKT